MDNQDFVQVFSTFAAIIIFLSLTYFYRKKLKSRFQGKKVDTGALFGILILGGSILVALLLM